MFAGQSIGLVIPCYEEEYGIQRVLERVPTVIDKVVVVDGDSQDSTAQMARKLGAEVVVEPRRGYGRAYKTGFYRCDTDIMVTCDGDGTYPIECTEELLAYMQEKDLDFLSASRFPLRDKNAMRYRNFFGNALITLTICTLFGEKITDGLSGMWAFRRKALELMRYTSNGWNFSEEIKIEAIINGSLRFGEYPIVYGERTGETKLFPWKVGVENLLFLFYKRLATLFADRRRPVPGAGPSDTEMDAVDILEKKAANE